jgi:hypothetical protein
MKRREFLRTGAAAAVAGAAGAAIGAKGLAAAGRQAEPDILPAIKLGTLEVSRLILGSNPFWGYSHKSAALDAEMRAFHTDERIAQILDEAAECGVTAVASPPDERWRKLWSKYTEGGGKLKTWISQCHGPADGMLAEIDRSVGAGARAIFIQGARVEDQFGIGEFKRLWIWVEHIARKGLPAGVAAHWPEIHPELQRRDFPVDFYFQCMYNASKTSDYSAAERKLAEATVTQMKKPVIAYKILAAGRLPPSEGFEQAFNNIRRKDGVCVGIYAQKAIDQIRQNATYVKMLTRG